VLNRHFPNFTPVFPKYFRAQPGTTANTCPISGRAISTTLYLCLAQCFRERIERQRHAVVAACVVADRSEDDE
jgi:hypothetical protein